MKKTLSRYIYIQNIKQFSYYKIFLAISEK